MSQPDTKQRILSASEHHFARDGYHATSLRSITATARVNLAAVNYHFGSKEALLEAVIERRLSPLNESRLAQLETLLHQAEQIGELPACRDILRTFIEPTLHLRQQGSGSENYITLIGRILAEPRGIAMSIFMHHMQPLMERLFQALTLSLPTLSRETPSWRIPFAIGSSCYISGCPSRSAIGQ